MKGRGLELLCGNGLPMMTPVASAGPPCNDDILGVPARVTYGKERSPLQKGYTTLTGLPLTDAVLIANLLGMTAPWFV